MVMIDKAPEVWVIVVAAGSGSRFGAPKQFSELGGERVVDRAIATATRHASGVVVVLPAGFASDEMPVTVPADAVVTSVSGAASRSSSVRCGLAAVPATADVVLVHDGARPLASDMIYKSVIASVIGGADAVVPAIAVTDTIRRRTGGVVDRSQLVAVQTPQGFRAQVLRDAHAAGAEATDDAALVEVAGGTVVVVNGDRRNLKITTPLDLDLAEVLLRHDSGSDD